MAMDSAFGPKPKDAPRPMQNPNPCNVFTEALTALGNFGRDAKSRQQETERQDAAYEDGTGPRPCWYSDAYRARRAAKKASDLDKAELREMQEEQFQALKAADKRDMGQKMYDAARGVITPYQCHWDSRLGRYGEPLNGQEQIKQLLDLGNGFEGLGLFKGINEKSAEGRTALHGACEVGDEAMLAWLLDECSDDSKIDVNIKDSAGLTALDIASSHGHTSCADMLRSHHGKLGIEISDKSNCTVS